MKSRRAFSLVEVIVVIGIIAVLLALTMPAILRARDKAHRAKCLNNLRQLGLALHQHHNELERLPPGCSHYNREDPYPFMSWCTRLLPYLGEVSLWQTAQAAYAKMRNSAACPPHVGDRILRHFLCPSEPREIYDGPYWRQGYTHYLGVEGINQKTKDGLLYFDSKVRLTDVLDGAANTIMVGERPPAFMQPHVFYGYWYAGRGQDQNGSANMMLGVRERATSPYLSSCDLYANRFQQGRRDYPCDALHFWSLHPGGAHFLFADGSVRFLNYSADNILPALATRAGGEAVTLPD